MTVEGLIKELEKFKPKQTVKIVRIGDTYTDWDDILDIEEQENTVLIL